MMSRKYAGRLLIMAMVLMMIHCSSDHPGQPTPGGDARLQASFLASSLVEEITNVSLEISHDTTTLFDQVTDVEDGVFDFGVITLPVGETRFKFEATNSAGAATYGGDTSLVVVGGVETSLEIELLPSIPMIKLSPYHASIGLNDEFSSTIEMFNIEKFFNGSFKIAYDPSYLTFDSTISQADIAWGELVLFARDIGDTVVVSVSRTQSSSDDVPPFTYSLLDLGFRARSSGNTMLEIIGDRVEDLDGTIQEIESVRFDNQSVTIQ